MPSMSPKIRMALLLGTMALLILCLGFAVIWPHALFTRIEGLLRATRNLGATGGVLFMCAQIVVALSGILPASMICVLAGAMYGFGSGFAIAALGTMVGAILAFALSRSFFRVTIERMLSKHKRLEDLDRIIAYDGWKIACLLRISPLMPFSATGFMLGLSSIRFRDYLIGTLASLPALIGYVFMGTIADSTLSAVTSGTLTYKSAFFAVGGLATLILTLYIGKIASKVGLLPGPGSRVKSMQGLQQAQPLLSPIKLEP
ncbi:MAG: VTT domain-containing protein [Syntrophobacteraceae bacterium]